MVVVVVDNDTKHKHISNDTHELTTIQQQEAQIHIKL